MSGSSTSTYPENLGSGGPLPAELRGRVCLFFVFYVAAKATLLHGKIGIFGGFFGLSSIHRGRTHIVLG